MGLSHLNLFSPEISRVDFFGLWEREDAFGTQEFRKRNAARQGSIRSVPTGFPPVPEFQIECPVGQPGKRAGLRIDLRAESDTVRR
jgi:hypothetical protein